MQSDLREAIAKELLRGIVNGGESCYEITDRILSHLPTQGGSPGSGARYRRALENIRKKCFDDSEWGRYIDAVLREPPEEGSAPVPTAEVGALRWTRENPTAEGFYWVCHDLGEACIVEISEIAGVWYVFDTDGSERHLSKFSHECQWAGPIPAPATPSGEGRQ